MLPRKPDGSKLWRAAEDALSGVIYTDDARMVRQHVERVYVEQCEQPGMHVEIRRME